MTWIYFFVNLGQQSEAVKMCMLHQVRASIRMLNIFSSATMAANDIMREIELELSADLVRDCPGLSMDVGE